MARSEFKLSPAVRSQVKELAAMVKEFHREDSIHFQQKKVEAALRELIQDKCSGRVWVIAAGGSMIGYVILTYGFSMEFHGRDGLLDEFFIRKPWRGAGIGRKVLREVLGYARKDGLTAIHLEVSAKKKNVERFYESMGFEVRDYYHLASKWL
ncbi:MAG: GNAT family N-acetyltransferase [Deltaproteobacteria bacterium]